MLTAREAGQVSVQCRDTPPVGGHRLSGGRPAPRWAGLMADLTVVAFEPVPPGAFNVDLRGGHCVLTTEAQCPSHVVADFELKLQRSGASIWPLPCPRCRVPAH